MEAVGDAFGKQLGKEGALAFRDAYGLRDSNSFYSEWDTNCWGCGEDPTGCDAGTWTEGNWYDISNSWNAIEVDYQALTTSGSLTLWLEGVQKQSLTSIDNDISSPLGTRTVTEARLGAQGIETGTRGALNFDDFESRRFSDTCPEWRSRIEGSALSPIPGCLTRSRRTKLAGKRAPITTTAHSLTQSRT